MPNLLTFEQVIKENESKPKLHLILGNGFSISKFPDIFPYKSLFERADFGGNDRLPRIFHNLGTNDFEQVLRSLRGSLATIELYGTSSNAIKAIREDIDQLKTVFINTVCANHPDTPDSVSEESYDRCFNFLWNFLKRENSRIFTMNYDLLLYWCLARRGVSNDSYKRFVSDGFSNPPAAQDDYVTWQGEGSAYFSKIWYVHGALHIFDAGTDIKKITYCRTSERLIEQTRAALNKSYFPIFVAEGESRTKIERIKHNPYLYTAFQRFSTEMKLTQNKNNKLVDTSVVIFGHSLGSVDDHFWEKLMGGTDTTVYISIHGGLGSPAGLSIQSNVARIYATYNNPTIRFKYFNSESAQIW